MFFQFNLRHVLDYKYISVKIKSNNASIPSFFSALLIFYSRSVNRLVLPKPPPVSRVAIPKPAPEPILKEVVKTEPASDESDLVARIIAQLTPFIQDSVSNSLGSST